MQPYMTSNINQRINYKSNIVAKGSFFGTLPSGYGIMTHHKDIFGVCIIWGDRPYKYVARNKRLSMQ